MSTEHKDLYDRFFDELADAIDSGKYTYAMQDGFSTATAFSAVCKVIKKYSANPHEPIQYKEDENKEK